jgi:hypothetical protein
LQSLLRFGASLLPPAWAPRIFQRTQPSALMDQVIEHLLQEGILSEERTTSAYRSFLVAKSDSSARLIIDLSPLTPLYRVPHITLYSAARVLSTLRPTDQLIKIDLTSGFYQIPIHPNHRRFYGIYYRGRHLALTRLPMGHPLAPYILQRVASSVAAHLNARFDVAMIAYLDDWLIFGPQLQASSIIQEVRRLGFTINEHKSSLRPASSFYAASTPDAAMSCTHDGPPYHHPDCVYIGFTKNYRLCILACLGHELANVHGHSSVAERALLDSMGPTASPSPAATTIWATSSVSVSVYRCYSVIPGSVRRFSSTTADISTFFGPDPHC